MTKSVDNITSPAMRAEPVNILTTTPAQPEDHSITLTRHLAKQILLDRETRENHIPVNTQTINQALWVLDPISDVNMWDILQSIKTSTNLSGIWKDLQRQCKNTELLTLTRENLNALLKQWDKAAVLIDNALICQDLDPQRADLELLKKYNQLPKDHPMRELVERRQKEREEMKKSASESSSHNSSPSSGNSSSISSGSDLNSKKPPSNRALWEETNALLEDVIAELEDFLADSSSSNSSSSSQHPHFSRQLALAQSLYNKGFPKIKIPLTHEEETMAKFLKSKSLSKKERTMRIAILSQIKIPFGR